MPGWLLIPGIVLLAASYVIQFGSFLRRPRAFTWIPTALRLRFIGFGALFLGAGLGLVISSMLNGLAIGSLLVGLFLMAMAGTWFYAASDKIFSVGSASWPGSPNSHGSQDGQTHDRH